MHRVVRLCGGVHWQRLILWLADEEFSARMIFLFDRSANQHFNLDGLWAVGKALANRLLQNIPEAKEKDFST